MLHSPSSTFSTSMPFSMGCREDGKGETDPSLWLFLQKISTRRNSLSLSLEEIRIIKVIGIPSEESTKYIGPFYIDGSDSGSWAWNASHEGSRNGGSTVTLGWAMTARGCLGCIGSWYFDLHTASQEALLLAILTGPRDEPTNSSPFLPCLSSPKPCYSSTWSDPCPNPLSSTNDQYIPPTSVIQLELPKTTNQLHWWSASHQKAICHYL